MGARRPDTRTGGCHHRNVNQTGHARPVPPEVQGIGTTGIVLSALLLVAAIAVVVWLGATQVFGA